MANLTALIGAGGILQIITDFVSETSLTTGTGEDLRYLNVDVTASSITDETKCVVLFEGGGGTSEVVAFQVAGSATTYACSARLTSATNLRLSCISTGAVYIVGRYYIIEYA